MLFRYELPVCFILVSVFSIATTAQEPGPSKEAPPISSTRQIAEKYLHAIETSDWEAMAELLADDAHYVDHSMTYFDRPSIEFNNRESIVKFWKDSAEQFAVASLKFKIDESFVAGQTVTFIITVDIHQAGKPWQIDKEMIQLSGRQITSVKIVEGKVVYHTDIVDYASPMKQIEKLRKQFGATSDGR